MAEVLCSPGSLNEYGAPSRIDGVLSDTRLRRSDMDKMLDTDSVRTFALALLVFAGGAASGFAQTEDVEPRIIGRRGTTLVGMAGSLSRFFSSEDMMPGSYTVQVDVHRFVFAKIAVRVGLVGSGQFGGTSSSDDDEAPGLATPSLEVLGGAVYYFTPQSIWSVYGGAEYRARLTERVEGDSGSVSGLAGLQGALSSRASFFLEGGYGMGLQRGDDGELLTRMVGQAGVRFRF